MQQKTDIVASLLAKLELSDKERKLIFQHLGHSKEINENVYQAPAGSMQLQTTTQRLLQINSSNYEQLKVHRCYSFEPKI